jgi:hypothetical protein
VALTKAQLEDAGVQVRKGIEASLADMRAYVTRKLARGEKVDRRLLNEITLGLEKIAQENSVKIAAGKWGDLLTEAMKESAARVSGVAGSLLSISQEQIASVLFAESRKIKDLTTPGLRIVSEELLANILGSKSQADVADAIEKRLVLTDEAGQEYAVPSWRAESQARNELSGYERMAEQAFAAEAGLDRFEMVGPDDERTNDDVCSDYLGEVHTMEEWDAIAEKEFAAGRATSESVLPYGFHPN